MTDFIVYACEEGRHRAHAVSADTAEAAAIGFVETWHPGFDRDGEVAVVVRDPGDGRETCLRVDMGGDVEPCD